ncbi:MAG: tetratricopeptide repeat protein [Planctomycetes bacterium]|nr:tetratricopeptide repeat protein [Planctomycetota bacterium]
MRTFIPVPFSRRLLLSLLLSAAVPRPFQAEEPSADDLFYKAYYLETQDRDLEKAIQLYREILSREPADESAAAKAQYQLGACYEKLGRMEEARKAYRSVLDRFGSHREMARKAEASLQSLPTTTPMPGDPAAGHLRVEPSIPAAGTAPRSDLADAGASQEFPLEEKIPAWIEALKSEQAGQREDAARNLVGAGQASVPALEVFLASPVGQDGWTAARAALYQIQGMPADPNQDAVEKLFENRISVDFRDTPLCDVVQFLCNLTGLNILVDDQKILGAERAPVTMKVEDRSLRNLLDGITRLVGLTYRMHEGALVITTAEGGKRLERRAALRAAQDVWDEAHPSKESGARQAFLNRLKNIKVSIDLQNTRLADALSYLGELGLPASLYIDEGCAGQPITLHGQEVPMSQVLSLVCDLNDLEVRPGQLGTYGIYSSAGSAGSGKASKRGEDEATAFLQADLGGGKAMVFLDGGIEGDLENGLAKVTYKGHEVWKGPATQQFFTTQALIHGRLMAAAFDGEKVLWENLPGAGQKLKEHLGEMPPIDWAHLDAQGNKLIVQTENNRTTIRHDGKEVWKGQTRGRISAWERNINGEDFAAVFDGDELIWENVPGAAQKVKELDPQNPLPPGPRTF